MVKNKWTKSNLSTPSQLVFRNKNPEARHSYKFKNIRDGKVSETFYGTGNGKYDKKSGTLKGVRITKSFPSSSGKIRTSLNKNGKSKI